MIENYILTECHAEGSLDLKHPACDTKIVGPSSSSNL